MSGGFFGEAPEGQTPDEQIQSAIGYLAAFVLFVIGFFSGGLLIALFAALIAFLVAKFIVMILQSIGGIR
jgi:uncharacterized membrane protein